MQTASTRRPGFNVVSPAPLREKSFYFSVVSSEIDDEVFEFASGGSRHTYCSLGKVYAATPGGGEHNTGTEGYLKMAAV